MRRYDDLRALESTSMLEHVDASGRRTAFAAFHPTAGRVPQVNGAVEIHWGYAVYW